LYLNIIIYKGGSNATFFYANIYNNTTDHFPMVTNEKLKVTGNKVPYTINEMLTAMVMYPLES